MKEQIALQQVLLRKYEELRSSNPHFSRRAFSKKLGLSAGAISELFNGQRKVSSALAQRIAQALDLDPQERSEILSLFPKSGQRDPGQSPNFIDPNYLRLSADQFRVIGDWYHFAILALMETRDFKSDLVWIAERFGLSQTIVRTAVERLKRLNFIRQDENGNLTPSHCQYRTSDDVSNASVRLAHFTFLEKARQALEMLAVSERDFTSLTLKMSPSQLPRAKEMIRKFQDELAAEMEADPQSDVYQLCIQLFPLTRVKKQQGET